MDPNTCFEYLNIGLPENILRRKYYGDLDGAVRLIDRALADPDTDAALRACMTAEREMMLRTPGDFPYTRETALKEIREAIPDFTDAEFDERVDRGTIRWIYLNGEPRYFESFFSTLVKTEPEFARRAGRVPTTLAAQATANPLDRCIAIMKEKGSMACRIRLRAGLTIDEAAFRPGMEALVTLPIPLPTDTQSEIVIEKIFPETGVIDPEDAPQRTVWWKETMRENHEFFVEYSYIHKEIYHGPDFAGEKDPDAAQYLGEQNPHIVFSPYIRNLTAAVTAGAATPMEKARRIYDHITLGMHYTYMPEYFTLESIAENCARSRTGDCGVFALLMITMLRCAGIPARWESGNSAEPDDAGCHDWVRYYAEPCGWLRADPSYGVSSSRAGNEERRDFYARNLEPYRMVANSAFQAPFLCGKQGWRADPYDNQSGEAEADGRGLKYGEFHTSKAVLSHEEL